MASIEFDIGDHLHEVSFTEIKREYMSRLIKARSPDPAEGDNVEPWDPAGLASDIRSAFYARNASRLELFLQVLEGWGSQ